MQTQGGKGAPPCSAPCIPSPCHLSPTSLHRFTPSHLQPHLLPRPASLPLLPPTSAVPPASESFPPCHTSLLPPLLTPSPAAPPLPRPVLPLPVSFPLLPQTSAVPPTCSPASDPFPACPLPHLPLPAFLPSHLTPSPSYVSPMPLNPLSPAAPTLPPPAQPAWPWHSPQPMQGSWRTRPPAAAFKFKTGWNSIPATGDAAVGCPLVEVHDPTRTPPPWPYTASPPLSTHISTLLTPLLFTPGCRTTGRGARAGSGTAW